MLILFVLSVAVMNFGLGYALAVLLSDAPLVPRDFVSQLKTALKADDEAPVDLLGEEAQPPTLAELPAAWRDQLSAAGLSPATWLQGLVLKLWVEVGPHREQMLSAEIRGRLALSQLDQGAQQQLFADAGASQQAWRGLIESVQRLLLPRINVLGPETALGEGLAQLLVRQAKSLALRHQELTDIALDRETELGARKLLASLAQSIAAAHDLRDGLLHLLASALRGAAAPVELGQPLYLDPLTGQISRLGLEGLFSLWWEEDPQRLRLASCALIKIDRFVRLNERLGHRAGDRVLTAIAGLLASAVRTDRGFDRLARYEGGTFLLFFGDTGPQNAALAVERVRQSFEALTLDYEGNEIDVSISAGIAPICRDDDFEKVSERAQAALRDAQKHGRNRTSVDNGEGPAPLYEPQRYPVRAKRVCIEAS